MLREMRLESIGYQNELIEAERQEGIVRHAWLPGVI